MIYLLTEEKCSLKGLYINLAVVFWKIEIRKML